MKEKKPPIPPATQEGRPMNKDDERSRLEEAAGWYHSDRLAGVNETYHRFVRDTLIPSEGGGKALELGCGNGSWTRILCERYDVVDVVEGSGMLIECIMRECGHGQALVRTHEMLVEDFLAAADETWKHVYMTFLLEHLDNPAAVLSSVRPLIESSGKMFLAVPNALSVHRMVALRMGLIKRPDELSENDRLVGHRRIYTPELLGSHLSDAGYSDIAITTVALKPLSLGQMKDWPPELVDAFCRSGDIVPGHGAYIVATASP